jgi:hypothetical protein
MKVFMKCQELDPLYRFTSRQMLDSLRQVAVAKSEIEEAGCSDRRSLPILGGGST